MRSFWHLLSLWFLFAHLLFLSFKPIYFDTLMIFTVFIAIKVPLKLSMISIFYFSSTFAIFHVLLQWGVRENPNFILAASRMETVKSFSSSFSIVYYTSPTKRKDVLIIELSWKYWCMWKKNNNNKKKKKVLWLLTWAYYYIYWLE